MTNEEKKTYLKTFGGRIKYYRELINMTQKELGLAVGYVDKTNPSSSISKIERGEMEITQTKIADIAKTLGISPSTFSLDLIRLRRWIFTPTTRRF